MNKLPADAKTEAEPGAADASEARPAPAWIVEPEPIPYNVAITRMMQMAQAIADGEGQERLWLLSHPPTITAGTSAVPEELLDPGGIPVVATGRGGRHTYHDPGQRIIYPLLDLTQRGRDVRRLVRGLEDWVIAAVARLGVAAHRSPLGTGVWTTTPQGELKIAAIGLRVRRWVSLHGVAINIDPDMRGFDAIVPCGIHAARPGRLVDLNPAITRAALDEALFRTRHHLIGS